jgi:hypothetical protein
MQTRALLLGGVVLTIAVAASAQKLHSNFTAQQAPEPSSQEQYVVDPSGKPTLDGLPPAKVTWVGEGLRHRYQTLLKTLEVPADHDAYGDFCDFGHWSGTSYAGHNDLPAGYWVYLAPNWYIFQDDSSSMPVPTRAPRQWGPEQATGAPDTWPKSGDIPTAWASKTPDGQREWLELTYATPLRPVAALVYETLNPGAVDRVTGYDASGNEVELWSGSDPTPAGKDKGISVIPLHPDFDVKRIRIYLDSQRVAGWNEIDAVGLIDDAGKTSWASSATASSTYADVVGTLPAGEAGYRGAGSEPGTPSIRLEEFDSQKAR